MTKRLNAVRPLVYPGIQLRYRTPIEIVKQAEIFLQINGRGRKGFRPSDIPAFPTSEPRTKRALLFPAIYLPETDEGSGLQRSFEKWWEYVVPPPGTIKHRVEGLKSGPDDLRLAPGIDYEPGVHWVEFDPVANQDMTSADVLAQSSTEGTSLAHVETLMAAAFYRAWVMNWNGKDSPYPNMSGLQVCTNGEWVDTPFLNRNRDKTGQNLLTMGLWGGRNKIWKKYWSSPEVRIIES